MIPSTHINIQTEKINQKRTNSNENCPLLTSIPCFFTKVFPGKKILLIGSFVIVVKIVKIQECKNILISNII